MISGPALTLGNDVNTDQLHPSKFYSLNDDKVRSGFLRAIPGREKTAEQDLSGCIVLAGRNFGCGSSRETGARVFLLAGVQAVVAVSFARIFYRNLLNLGLHAIVCPALAEVTVEDGTTVQLDLDEHRLIAHGFSLDVDALDPHWQSVLDAGGLSAFLGLE
jgi:3-isopropylmalate dehydratase small subunit